MSLSADNNRPGESPGRIQGAVPIDPPPARWNSFLVQDMKMLFSSRDRSHIEYVREKLVAAGIRCEVRSFLLADNVNGPASYPELWVEANTDYHTASILYASPISLLRQRSLDPHSVS